MAYVQKIYANSTASADAVASVDIQEDTVIEGLQMDLYQQGLTVQDEGSRWEVSFASTSGFSANDTRASIAGISNHLGVVTTGGAPQNAHLFVPCNIPVQAGERLYVHTSVVGTITVNTLQAWLYLRGGNTPARRPNFRA